MLAKTVGLTVVVGALIIWEYFEFKRKLDTAVRLPAQKNISAYWSDLKGNIIKAKGKSHELPF